MEKDKRNDRGISGSVGALQNTPTDQDALLIRYKKMLKMPDVSKRVKWLSMQSIANIQLQRALGNEVDVVSDSRLNEAIFYLERVLQEAPDAYKDDSIYYQLARAYAIRGDKKISVSMLQKILEEYPGSVYFQEAIFRIAENNFLHENYTGAVEGYRMIVEGVRRHSVFYEKASYMYSWALYKSGNTRQAVDAFLYMLDKKNDLPEKEGDKGNPQKGLWKDLIRGLGLSLVSLYPEPDTSRHINILLGDRSYAADIYRWVAQYYISKERYQDASRMLSDFSLSYPDAVMAPVFFAESARVLDEAGFPVLALKKKTVFVMRYDLNNDFWVRHKQNDYPYELAYLKQNLLDIARFHHASAQQSQRREEYRNAAEWYGRFLSRFPDDEKVPEVDFLMAEALYESEDYIKAATEYENVAYAYADTAHAAEAGYAALLAFQNYADDPKQANLKWLASAKKFITRFPEHPARKEIAEKIMGELFIAMDWENLIIQQKKILQEFYADDAGELLAGWERIGDAEVEMKNFVAAVNAYQTALSFAKNRHSSKAASISKKIAASYYRNAERLRDVDSGAAVKYFLLAQKTIPVDTIGAAALYDAGTVLLKEDKLMEAARVFESFQYQYPGHSLQTKIPGILSSVYMQIDRPLLAAAQFEKVVQLATDTESSKAALWSAAALYYDASHWDDARRLYRRYITLFPQEFVDSMEAMHKLSEISKVQGNDSQYLYWLKKIMQSNAEHSDLATGYSNSLAATASLVFADKSYQRFDAIPLKVPFAVTLKSLQEKMNAAVTAYKKSMAYGIAEVTTQATFRMGEIYRRFAEKIMDSERPAGLNEMEREEYGFMLEDQAFKYEEQAIKLHERNYAYLKNDYYYGEFIRASLEVLARLVPGTYAKQEVYLESYKSLQ